MKIGDHDESKVEDMTGGIPLLLDKCVVNGKVQWNAKDLREIYDRAAGFARHIRSRLKGDSLNWDLYV